MDWKLAVLTGLGILFFAFLVMLIRHKTYWFRRGIPYTNTFPIFGIVSSILFRRKSTGQLSRDLYLSHPGAKYFGAMNFGVPLLIVKDPEIIREIVVKSFDYFPNHRSFIVEEFDPLLSRNIFSLKNESWREMRTILSPSFTAVKMKFMFDLVAKCSTDFVQYLKDHPEVTKELDLQDAYTRYTNDVIATAAFGISVDSMKDRDNDFYESGKDAVSFTGLSRWVKIMAARLFPRLMRILGYGFLSRKTDKFFKKLVTETVKMREKSGLVRPDMIHLLMQAKMTTDDIIAQAFIFFLAGFDTSSRLMCFASHLLSHHSDIQDKLRREIDRVFSEEHGDISYEALGKMEYLDMVLKETLRLYPPTPLIDRVCRKAYTLPSPMEGFKAFTVQPNTSLWIPTFGFHRDPNYFPEPDVFDPQRFSEENKKLITPYTYMPFGFGPRKCIGERFALMETKILMINLLRNFVFLPSDKTTEVITLSKDTFQMGSEKGFWMTLVARK